jgi:hypothetical protein
VIERSSRSRPVSWPEGWADDGTKTYGETVLQFGGPATAAEAASVAVARRPRRSGETVMTEDSSLYEAICFGNAKDVVSGVARR